MTNQPNEDHRPDAQRTIQALTTGTVLSVAVLSLGFVLRLAGQSAAADTVSTIGVVVLLATPAAALVTTALELRGAQRSAAALAVLVLVILAGATVLALLTSR